MLRRFMMCLHAESWFGSWWRFVVPKRSNTLLSLLITVGVIEIAGRGAEPPIHQQQIARTMFERTGQDELTVSNDRSRYSFHAASPVSASVASAALDGAVASSAPDCSASSASVSAGADSSEGRSAAISSSEATLSTT